MVGNSALASRLKRRITLRKPVQVSDGVGGFTVSWQNFASVWAEIMPKSGGDSLQEERIIGVKKMTVVIRYLEGVTSDMRIVYGARFFEIVSILNPYEENVMLEIVAEEII